jgi:hypothetical protein
MPLTDTHLVLLSAASQRDDGLLPRPARVAGAALQRLEAALLKSTSVEAVPIRSDQPAWRRDGAELPIGLRITRIGLAAIGIETADGLGWLQDPARAAPGSGAAAGKAIAATAPSPTSPFRAGSKQAQLCLLLSAPDGATADALAAALDWLPHTVRAAVTQLRQRGVVVSTVKSPDGRTVYRITAVCEPDGDDRGLVGAA